MRVPLPPQRIATTGSTAAGYPPRSAARLRTATWMGFPSYVLGKVIQVGLLPVPAALTAAVSAALAAGDSRQDGDFVALLDGGIEAIQEADVFPFDVDVHEPPQVAVLGDPLA